MLLVLLAASGLVFIIACSNVANLILARTVRREGELTIRAALGASTAALRRTLLAESLLLCGAGAALGVLSARADGGHPGALRVPFFGARAGSSQSIRACCGWAPVWPSSPRSCWRLFRACPPPDSSHGFGLASGSTRITGSANRRQRVFAVTQIAASFVLLAGAAMLLKTLLALQAAQTGFDTRHVLAINVPVMSYGKTPDQVLNFYKTAIGRITELPGVDGVAAGSAVPWRDANQIPGFEFLADGHVHQAGRR